MGKVIDKVKRMFVGTYFLTLITTFIVLMG